MSDLFRRKTITINADIKMDKELEALHKIKDNALEIRSYARFFSAKPFDAELEEEPEGSGNMTFRLTMEINDSSILAHAQRIADLAEEMEKEAQEICSSLNTRMTRHP